MIPGYENKSGWIPRNISYVKTKQILLLIRVHSKYKVRRNCKTERQKERQTEAQQKYKNITPRAAAAACGTGVRTGIAAAVYLYI